MRQAHVSGARFVVSSSLLCATFAAATWVAAPADAQSAAQAPAPTVAATTATEVKSDNGQVVTMVGCVMIGGGTSFTLANVTNEKAKGKPVAGHEGNEGGPYALVERDGLDLSPFVNQKVELTGVAVPAATKGDRDDKFEIKETMKAVGTGGRESTSSSRETVKVERGDMNKFLVASVKPVAPSCE